MCYVQWSTRRAARTVNVAGWIFGQTWARDELGLLNDSKGSNLKAGDDKRFEAHQLHCALWG